MTDKPRFMSLREIENVARAVYAAPHLLGKLATLLEEALSRKPNCVHVQADLDAGRPAMSGTCWWSRKEERLRSWLPANACWSCRAREALRNLEAPK